MAAQDGRRNIYSLSTFHAYVVSMEDQSETVLLRKAADSHAHF
jgi:hypothetical protein